MPATSRTHVRRAPAASVAAAAALALLLQSVGLVSCGPHAGGLLPQRRSLLAPAGQDSAPTCVDAGGTSCRLNPDYLMHGPFTSTSKPRLSVYLKLLALTQICSDAASESSCQTYPQQACVWANNTCYSFDLTAASAGGVRRLEPLALGADGSGGQSGDSKAASAKAAGAANFMLDPSAIGNIIGNLGGIVLPPISPGPAPAPAPAPAPVPSKLIAIGGLLGDLGGLLLGPAASPAPSPSPGIVDDRNLAERLKYLLCPKSMAYEIVTCAAATIGSASGADAATTCNAVSGCQWTTADDSSQSGSGGLGGRVLRYSFCGIVGAQAQAASPFGALVRIGSMMSGPYDPAFFGCCPNYMYNMYRIVCAGKTPSIGSGGCGDPFCRPAGIGPACELDVEAFAVALLAKKDVSKVKAAVQACRGGSGGAQCSATGGVFVMQGAKWNDAQLVALSRVETLPPSKCPAKVKWPLAY